MPDPLKILVPVLLVAEALTVQWAGHAERVPVAPDLNAFPRQIGRWSQLSEISIEPEVQAQLRADRLLDRMYYSGTSAGPVVQAELLVAWFNSQTKGSTAAFASGMPAGCGLVAGIDQHGPHRDAGRAVGRDSVHR